ncbi:MAG: riboflavin biosynthesis protein RibF [Planctomycetes bacterium GWF2_41_51]|nr:MAG: riboflavin biosynthesis protein RibF [Planctomycetes bacterium GWF2_41_51]HBG25996.1 bifunctional riboflavin kinase/FAD synthetase [Phycisphaerales bacterium]
MQIIDKLDKIDDGIRHCCLTIGNFDGFHRGHQEIIRVARETSEKLGNCPVAVMTFDPHPTAILHPEMMPRILTPLSLRSALLESAGVDYLIVLKDNYQMLTLSPHEFVENFLMKSISPKAVIEGDDFRFGYGRSGDVYILSQIGKTFGFDVIVVKPENVQIDNVSMRISSTMIRHLLHKGNVAEAAAALGRPYRLMGNVVKGRGKGTELGFPTANIDPHEQIIPVEGVYAGFVSLADSVEKLITLNQKLPAVFSLGRAKTFVSDHPMLIEAHLFDENIGDLYGKYLAMDFVDFIRTQQRFESEQKLKEQIEKDCRVAQNILLNE